MARQVAEVLQRFITVSKRLHCIAWIGQPTQDLCQDYTHFCGCNPLWRVGAGFIQLGDIYFLELRHISKASWMPVFQLRVPVSVEYA